MKGEGPVRIAVCLCLAVVLGCHGGPREPVALDLTTLGLALVDGVPRPLPIETAGGHRRIVAPPGAAIELVVRLPRDARLRFTIDPRTPEQAFGVSVGNGSDEHPTRLRRVEG